MKVLLLTLAVVCGAARTATAAAVQVGSTSCAGSSDGTNVNLTISTTGANFLVMMVTGFSLSGGTPIVSDQVGGNANTWTARTLYESGTEGVRLYYVQNPTYVGASHQFAYTNGGGGNFPTICVMAFSGMKTTGVYASENGGSGASVTTFQPGSVTPSAAGLVIAAVNLTATSRTVAINSSFTGLAQVANDGATHYGGAMAFLVTSGTQNPTWTVSGGSMNISGSNTVFLDAAGGGGGPSTRSMLGMIGK